MMDAEEGMISVEAGRIWYGCVGRGGIPLLVFHGGPGAGHDYLEPLDKLAPGRKVVFYDQLGCGRSDRPDDRPLWRMEYFAGELSRVRDALGLKTVHLFGQSWGGWLAIEYMHSNPDGVVSLVLASTSASIPQSVAEAARLKAALPPGVYHALQQHEAAGDLDHPEYEAAVRDFYSRHVCRLDPWRECLLRTVRNLDGNTVYETMNGPNEFTVVGTLKDWDRIDRLGEIKVPTLITVGRYDEITPARSETLRRSIAQAELRLFPAVLTRLTWKRRSRISR